MAEFEEEITRDISRQARLEDLEDRTRTVSQSEVLSGRSAGVAQADILARTFSEDAPMRMRQVTQRESTNVEDRRFIDDPVDPDAPLAIGSRVVGQEWTAQDQADYEVHRRFGTPDRGPSLRSARFSGSDVWSQVKDWGLNAYDELETTMKLWTDPKSFQVPEGTPPGEAAVIEANKESRKFTGVVDAAMAVTGGGYARGAPGLLGRALEGAPLLPQAVTELAAGGASVGRTPPVRIIPLKTTKGEDFSISQSGRAGSWEMTKDGKKAGEFSIKADQQSPGMLNIDEISTADWGTPRGTGLSKPVYDHFKSLGESIGQPLVPSSRLTEESYSNWRKMDPDLLGKGDYKKIMTDEGPRWERQDHTFTTEAKALLDKSGFPDQGVMDLRGMGGTVYREKVNAVRSGKDITAAPPPEAQIDVSISPKIPKPDMAKAEKLIEKKSNEVVAQLTKEMPDLQFELERSGMSSYIKVKDERGTILKARVSDHAATRFDALSIDPVSGNTVDTLIEALKYERGLTDQPPTVGWSLVPAKGLRGAMNREAGMDVFPDGRQIGGRAVYQRGGYRTKQDPFDQKVQTIGTDIQWKLPSD
jgi:hypothetical protein